ncbi:arylesterase, partial [Candidatus Thioglobus sp.]|nr:arylesterase [Candidatus Thioglobus sp.]
AGYGLSQNENLASELMRNFEDKKISVSIINASISGNTSKNGLSRVDWSLGDKPNIVVVCLGANDMLRGLNPLLTMENLDSIITKFNQSNSIVILAGMQSPESMGPDYKIRFDGIYPQLAAKYDLIFMPFLLKDVALEKINLQADYKHPNKRGIKIIASNLYPYILEGITRLER